MALRARRGRTGSAVALLSGGLDSSVAAVLARRDHARLALVTFDYGQANRRELRAAAAVAAWLQPEGGHHVVALDFSAVAAAQKSKLLAGAGEGAAEFRYYVPARNLIFLAHAAALAEVWGADAVYVGCTLQDAPHANSAGYPDSTPAFLAAVQAALREGLKFDRALRIEAPLAARTKFDAIGDGRRLGLDFGITWSCYSENDAVACADCPACWSRLLSFHWAGLQDPIPYALPHDEALERALAQA